MDDTDICSDHGTYKNNTFLWTQILIYLIRVKLTEEPGKLVAFNLCYLQFIWITPHHMNEVRIHIKKEFNLDISALSDHQVVVVETEYEYMQYINYRYLPKNVTCHFRNKGKSGLVQSKKVSIKKLVHSRIMQLCTMFHIWKSGLSLWDFKFSQRRAWRWLSFGILKPVV
jgi:hypothetical protein